MRDRVVIVTGGASGIGRATAARFAAKGARVAIWDVDVAAGDATAAELSRPGHEVRFDEVDVRHAEAVDAAERRITARWQQIDVLVNNAGITRDAQLVRWKDEALSDRLGDEAFGEVLDVNLRGVFLCTRAVAPGMIARRRGVILNASSVVARSGNFGQTNYAAAKAGVVAMTRTWARELGRYGLRVNAVAPGFIETAMALAVPPRVLSSVVERTPLGRMGRPEEVAAVYVWLASDAASFVHGAVIPVDGGLVLGT